VEYLDKIAWRIFKLLIFIGVLKMFVFNAINFMRSVLITPPKVISLIYELLYHLWTFCSSGYIILCTKVWKQCLQRFSILFFWGTKVKKIPHISCWMSIIKVVTGNKSFKNIVFSAFWNENQCKIISYIGEIFSSSGKFCYLNS
jgi:hypothetical protein